MEKISINLLPIEFKTEQIKRAKFYKVQILGVSVILLVIFLASLVIALRVLQSQNLNRLQDSLGQTEQKISNLKDKQASLFIIKDRLTSLTQYIGVPSKQSAAYRLVESLLPVGVSIGNLNVDRSGDVSISAVVPDADSLDNMISNFLDKEKNEGKISQVSIDSLSQDKTGVFRITLKIKSKS